MIPVLCFVSTLLSLTHNNNDYGGNEEKEKKKELQSINGFEKS